MPIAPTLLDPNLGVTTIVSLPAGSNPTNMAFLGDNDFFLIEKSTGKVDHVINGVVDPTHFDFGMGSMNNLPVNFASERGLLGITLSPDFTNDHGVYLFWTQSSTGMVTNNTPDTPLLGNRVDRFVWNPSTSTFTFDHNIVSLHSFQHDGNSTASPYQGNHNGGVIHFGPDGKLYIVIGDNGRRGWMQNLIDGPNGPGQTDENFGEVRGGPSPDDAHLTGVLLRLNPDGSTPDDNPFTDINTTLQAPMLSGGNMGATGSFTLFLNQAQDTFTAISTVQGLPGGTIAGQVRLGSADGPVIFSLPAYPTGQTRGQYTTTLTAANFVAEPPQGINTLSDAVHAVLNGQAHFTVYYTGGEISGTIGQLDPSITTNLHKVYAYGIRNTFGYDWDPISHRLWLEENGDVSFDKLSIVDPGSNNAWISSSAPLVYPDGSFDTQAYNEFISIETQLNPNVQQARYPISRFAATPQEAMSRLVMLPGAHYNNSIFSVRYEDPPAGLGFLSSNALGDQYQNTLFEGEARDFSTDPREEFDGALFNFQIKSDRSGIDFGGDPNIRSSDGVFENQSDFDLNGDTSYLLGTGFGILTGIQTGPDGNLYLVSETKNAVFEVYRNPVNGAFHSTNLVSSLEHPPGGDPIVVDPSLRNPWGVALSPTSPFWVANQRTAMSTLYTGDVAGGTFMKNPLTVTDPPRTDVLVGSRVTNSLLRFNQVTGTFLDAFVTAGSGGLRGPGGVAIGPDGNLYVSSNMSNSVLRFNGTTGAFLDTFVPSGLAGLNKPSGLLFGPDGNLYVNSHGPASQHDTSAVLRFDGTTGAPLPAPGQMGADFVPAGSGGLDQASVGLVFGPDGNLYINSHLTNSVLRFDGVTGDPRPAPGQSGADFVPLGSGGLLQPSGLVFGPDGHLYVGAHDPSAGHGAVLRYDETTGDPLPGPGQTGAFFVPIDSGGLANPTALTFGPDGNLYVDSRRNSRVLRFDGRTGEPLPAAGQTEAIFVPQGSGGLNAPTSLNFFGAAKGSPTGQVFNGTADFVINAGGQSGPARFITASLDGVIAGWNSNVPVPGSTQAFVAASVPGATYTGLAIGNYGAGNFLYAANVSQGRIDTFDAHFTLVTPDPTTFAFSDPDLPADTPWKPFNIQNLAGTLYVTYRDSTNPEHGGIVDAFDTNGNFLQRVATGGLNAPWGLALAPADFGPFGGALLVGNFGLGDGKINAYYPSTGQFLGYLSDATGTPLAFEGLWSLTFGNGTSGDSNALYFTAGINRTGAGNFGAQDGLFGSIRFDGGAHPHAPGNSRRVAVASSPTTSAGDLLTGPFLGSLTEVPGTPITPNLTRNPGQPGLASNPRRGPADAASLGGLLLALEASSRSPTQRVDSLHEGTATSSGAEALPTIEVATLNSVFPALGTEGSFRLKLASISGDPAGTTLFGAPDLLPEEVFSTVPGDAAGG